MTLHCPFCGSPIVICKEKPGWFFRCTDEHHRFQFEGMQEDALLVDTIEMALCKWEAMEERFRRAHEVEL